MWQLKGSIAELEREHSVAEKTQKKNSKNMKELSSEIKKLASKLNTLSNPPEPLPPTRKRGADDTELAKGIRICVIFKVHSDIQHSFFDRLS